MKSLIVFDYAESVRKGISDYCKSIEKSIVFPKDMASLQDLIIQGERPLITEFNLLMFPHKEDDIELLLSMIGQYQVPTAINTNAFKYKDYLEKIKETKNIHYILEKSPTQTKKLKEIINHLIQEPEYIKTNIIELKRSNFDPSKDTYYNPIKARSKGVKGITFKVPHPTKE